MATMSHISTKCHVAAINLTAKLGRKKKGINRSHFSDGEVAINHRLMRQSTH